MPHPCPHHCPKDGGSGAAVIIAIALVIAAAGAVRAAARPIEHAAETGLEVLAITIASVAGVAAIGGIAYVALRARERRANDITAVSFHPPSVERGAPAISAPQQLAIEPPRPRLADLKAMAAEHGYDLKRRDTGG